MSNELHFERRETSVSLKEAREMFKDRLFGSEEIFARLGIRVSETEIPPIHFSRERLELAKERGEFLVFQIAKDEQGSPLNLKELVKKNAHLFLNFDPNNSKESFVDETPRPGWKLVSNGCIPDSMDSDYEEQTYKLFHYLLDAGEVSATTQYTEKFEGFINEHRRMPVEVALHATLFGDLPEGPYSLTKEKDRTSTRDKSGDYVCIGQNLEGNGMALNSWPEDQGHRYIGVVAISH